jgi:hypothetical protein
VFIARMSENAQDEICPTQKKKNNQIGLAAPRTDAPAGLFPVLHSCNSDGRILWQCQLPADRMAVAAFVFASRLHTPGFP